MLKKVQIIFVAIVVVSALVGCSCSSGKEASGRSSSSTTQEVTTNANVDSEGAEETKADSSVDATVNNTENNSELTNNTETANNSDETKENQTAKESQAVNDKTTASTQATKESQTTKKQEASKETQTTKKQEITKETQTTKNTQTTKETQTTKKQQTTKIPETTKVQETTTKKNETPAAKGTGVIYDTLTVQYINRAPYTIPDNYEQFMNEYVENGGTYDSDQVGSDGVIRVDCSVGLFISDEESAVKENVFGNELRMSYGENIDSVKVIKELYGEPLCATDLDDGGAFDYIAYKYKTDKTNNEYEIFIMFMMYKKELAGVSYLIGTEDVMRQAIEKLN